MNKLKMSLCIIRGILLSFDAFMVLYKMAIGKTFTLTEFFSYLFLNVVLFFILYEIGSISKA
jgi:hypothetical protein